MSEKLDKPIGLTAKPTRSQEFYDSVKRKFAEERDLRLKYRPQGLSNYTYELTGALAKYEVDTYAEAVTPREPLNDTVECLFIGGGFSALLTSARLREVGVESIRIVERASDVGGTWYWNRYPGVACDVVSYDYLPLLDELDYVPKDHYAGGPEIFAHCQAIARKYNLYELAVFQTTVTSSVWNETEQLWHSDTDRGDHMKAPSRAIPFTPRAGTTPTPSPTCRDSRTKSSASSAPARRPFKRFRVSARRRRNSMCSSARPPRSTSATTG